MNLSTRRQSVTRHKIGACPERVCSGRAAPCFSSCLAAWGTRYQTLRGETEPEEISDAWVTADFFSVLRTPVSEKGNGRNHNPYGFTMWLAGGGVKAGLVYGAIDEFGFKAVEQQVSIHDLHATVLHLLGLDHEKLT